ncbi:MAG: tRNA threonylcarbamoyladenosine dehydratase [Firmicutes bacterium]|nr:tRNA threonylcarbamoyladenosine dehydratase [Bacillota bacterium]
MNDQFERTRMLIGQDNLDRLKEAKVLVFGVGGVGGYVCEGLCRAGIGRIDIVDKDSVDITNINRQIIATYQTLGRPKVEVCRERMLSINPDIRVDARQCFYLPEKSEEFDFGAYDYVVDAVDNVTAKLDIICNAKTAGVPVISSMGTGNKLNPFMFKIADIEKTRVCPLAKVIRKELRKRGITGVKVLYSEEEPIKPAESRKDTAKITPASISFVPSCAGLMIAGRIVLDILKM